MDIVELVGGWALPLCQIWKSIGMMKIPIYGKIKFMFQTTNQMIYPTKRGDLNGFKWELSWNQTWLVDIIQNPNSDFEGAILNWDWGDNDHGLLLIYWFEDNKWLVPAAPIGAFFWTERRVWPEELANSSVRGSGFWAEASSKTILYAGWWLTYPSEKYESQLGWGHPQYIGK